MDTHKGDSSRKTNSPRIRAGGPPASHSLSTMRNTVNSFRDRLDYFSQKNPKTNKKTQTKNPKSQKSQAWYYRNELRSDKENEEGVKIEARKYRRGGLQVSEKTRKSVQVWNFLSCAEERGKGCN